jgi:hypothetical protein
MFLLYLPIYSIYSIKRTFCKQCCKNWLFRRLITSIDNILRQNKTRQMILVETKCWILLFLRTLWFPTGNFSRSLVERTSYQPNSYDICYFCLKVWPAWNRQIQTGTMAFCLCLNFMTLKHQCNFISWFKKRVVFMIFTKSEQKKACVKKCQHPTNHVNCHVLTSKYRVDSYKLRVSASNFN